MFGLQNKRVHLLTSWGCNNDCIFCMEDKKSRSFISLKDAKRQLLSGLEYSDEVTITSWEPTIHPKIIKIASLAKKIWYRRIQLISNWKKLSWREFVKTLIKAWITDFIISLHWLKSETHNKLVRTKAFRKTMKGFLNIVSLKNEYDLVLNTNTTICKSNLWEIYDLTNYFNKCWVDSIVLNTLIPNGEAKKNLDSLMIRYSELFDLLKKMEIYFDKNNSIYFNWLPYCIWNNFSDLIWYREPVTFNNKWSKIIRKSW